VLGGIVLLVLGVSVTISGMGLTLSFGVLAFIGMPLLIIGLGLISAATESFSTAR
jgi:hypothetical protein